MAVTRTGLVYGVGAVRGPARGRPGSFWAVHRAALAHGIVPVVPVSVIAEGFRTEARGDRIQDLLDGSEIEVMDADWARRVGELAVKASTTDLLAASVAETSAEEKLRRRRVGDRTRCSTAAGLLGHKLILHAV